MTLRCISAFLSMFVLVWRRQLEIYWVDLICKHKLDCCNEVWLLSPTDQLACIFSYIKYLPWWHLTGTLYVCIHIYRDINHIPEITVDMRWIKGQFWEFISSSCSPYQGETFIYKLMHIMHSMHSHGMFYSYIVESKQHLVKLKYIVLWFSLVI